MMRRTALAVLAVAVLYAAYAVIQANRPTRRLAVTVLRAADTLIWHKPDSALHLLGSVPPSALKGDGERALWGLLKVMGEVRCGRHPENDSLISLVAGHYRHQCDKRDRYASVLYVYSEYHIERKEYAAALRVLKEAETSLPDVRDLHLHTVIHSNMGYVMRASGDLEAAYEHYRYSENVARRLKCGEMSVKVQNALLTLPPVYGDEERAAPLVRALAGRAPHLTARTRAYVYNNIGWYYEQKGRRDSADLYYRLSIGVKLPDYHVPYQNLIRLLLDSGNYSTADSFARLLPPSADSVSPGLHHLNLSRLEYRRGKYMNSADHAMKYALAMRDYYEHNHIREITMLRRSFDRERQELMYRMDVSYLRSCYATGLLACLLLTAGVLYRLYRSRRSFRRKLREHSLRLREIEGLLAAARGDPAETERLSALVSEQAEQISALDRQSARWQAIYRMQSLSQRLTPEDVRALSLYVDLRYRLRPYQSETDYGALCHWLNLTDGGFADRLKDYAPTLTPTEVETALFVRVGFSLEETAGLMDVRPISIKQRVYRCCPKLGIARDLMLYRREILAL